MNSRKKTDWNKNSHSFFNILQSIKKVITEEYGLQKVTIRKLKTDGSRLSTPIKIEGLKKNNTKVTYFGKIIGHDNTLTFRSIQLIKNVYLQLYDHEPLFEVFNTPKESAQDQFKTLDMIYKIGIPTPKPYGCHQLQENHWLLVEEYLQAKPLSLQHIITAEQIDTVFKNLRKLHKKKIFHGDLKSDNILISDKIYFLDVGSLKKSVSPIKKRGYDIASMICSFLVYQPAEDIVRIVRKYYPRRDLRASSEYIELVQMRPDIYFNNEMKKKLVILLNKKIEFLKNKHKISK